MPSEEEIQRQLAFAFPTNAESVKAMERLMEIEDKLGVADNLSPEQLKRMLDSMWRRIENEKTKGD